ncbi:MAG: peptidoglycan-associated lipoprotein Pal [Desulfovibrio sp.]|jgi:peptidoglycan-associated lipoprotein|nr:peptidoglycan-associated lipoprotein Pal [Desulfovibrio sp.]
MNKFIRSGLLCAILALAIAAGAGCAKKEVGQTLDDDELAMTESERQAAAAISNGIIYFAYDSFDLAEQSKGILTQKAPVLKQFPQLRVVIEGHCDERGTEEYNLALGERRARAASDFLLNLGVPASQLQTVSFGKLHPAVMGSGESAWSKNRRDEFKVFKPKY